MRALLRRIAIAAYVLICLTAGLAALVIVGQRGYGPLYCSIGVSTVQIPVSVKVLDSGETPAANLQIECRAVARDGVIATTDAWGDVACQIPVISEITFYGVFCVRQTYNTLEFDVFEVRPDGTRQRLEPVEFSHTAASMAMVCRRIPAR